MTTIDKTVYEEIAHQAAEEDSHYVTKVTDMSDHKEVTSSEDIYSASGIKLIKENTIIGSNLREVLIKHKLCKPIDQSLTVQNGVTLDSLAREVSLLIKKIPACNIWRPSMGIYGHCLKKSFCWCYHHIWRSSSP
ncbi:hypothetical protein NTGBS_340005 [Candidatus Nitrotoga sp. BS]|nr:hypothetical protein NTGBS_340005 [Candidatus Nitrotoga sp. BS]